LPAVRHPVVAQGLQLGPSQLHRVIAKNVGQQFIRLGLLPGP
jgi:hypothetical protein